MPHQQIFIKIPIFNALFCETQRNKKNAVKTTKFRVVPSRKVPYVHVSHCNCGRQMNDIYTENYAKIILHISILIILKNKLILYCKTYLFGLCLVLIPGAEAFLTLSHFDGKVRTEKLYRSGS